MRGDGVQLFFTIQGECCVKIFFTLRMGGAIFLVHLENVELSLTQPQSETVSNYEVVSV